jgi:hypothetical protein
MLSPSYSYTCYTCTSDACNVGSSASSETTTSISSSTTSKVISSTTVTSSVVTSTTQKSSSRKLNFSSYLLYTSVIFNLIYIAFIA